MDNLKKDEQQRILYEPNEETRWIMREFAWI